MIVYFSGTGNSRYCAEILADKLNDKAIDSFHFIKDGIQAELLSAKPWVFVAPVYAWRMPHIFSDFLKSSCFQGCDEAYFLLTCGSDIGDAGSYAKELCGNIGLRFMGMMPIVMPENYIAMFSAPGEDESREIVAKALPALEKAAGFIAKAEPFSEKKISAVDRKKSGVINSLFYKRYIKAKSFYAKDSCTGCGKCEKLCVLNNIKIENGKPVWGGNCTHCMACICYCPVEAIEYGRISKGKRRYQGPVYKSGKT